MPQNQADPASSSEHASRSGSPTVDDDNEVKNEAESRSASVASTGSISSKGKKKAIVSESDEEDEGKGSEAACAKFEDGTEENAVMTDDALCAQSFSARLEQDEEELRSSDDDSGKMEVDKEMPRSRELLSLLTQI